MTTILATWEKPGKVAVEAGWLARQEGADLRTTLERGLAATELDPELLAVGLGSLPNSDGEVELDASIMDGADLSAGAVCAMRGIVPAISVARRVMERTPHVMLAGDSARQFAIQQGFSPQNLMTDENIRRYEQWRQRPADAESEYVHSTVDESALAAASRGDGVGHDTVTMLGFEDPGHFVAASSTSGLAWKMAGRVGDSPIIGAGIYADDEAGAAGATGFGEELWKAVASFRTVENMRGGQGAQEACDEVVRHMLRRQPRSLDMPCVVLALDRAGGFGAATTVGEFQLWICQDGATQMRRVSALNM